MKHVRSGSGSIEVWSSVRHPNTHLIASRQVSSGSAVVLLDPDVLVESDVLPMGPVVDVEPAAGWYFSSESKQPPKSPRHAQSAPRAACGRKDRATRVREPSTEAKDIGAR